MNDFLKAVGWHDFVALTTAEKVQAIAFVLGFAFLALIFPAIVGA